MAITSVRLSDEMSAKLTNLAATTKRSKSSYINEALEMYIEDMADINIALYRMSLPNRRLLTSSELKKRLGIDD